MADERREDKVHDVQRSVEVTDREEFAEKNQWVSFGEESSVPFLPQPPSRVNDLNSEKYIDRLERKLHRLKYPSNVTSKNIVSALTEAREGQMSNMMSDRSSDHWNISTHSTSDMNWNEDIHESKCCCVSCCTYLFPKKQVRTSQEIECLLDGDELATINSEQTEHVREGQWPVQT